MSDQSKENEPPGNVSDETPNTFEKKSNTITIKMESILRDSDELSNTFQDTENLYEVAGTKIQLEQIKKTFKVTTETLKEGKDELEVSEQKLEESEQKLEESEKLLAEYKLKLEKSSALYKQDYEGLLDTLVEYKEEYEVSQQKFAESEKSSAEYKEKLEVSQGKLAKYKEENEVFKETLADYKEGYEELLQKLAVSQQKLEESEGKLEVSEGKLEVSEKSSAKYDESYEGMELIAMEQKEEYEVSPGKLEVSEKSSAEYKEGYEVSQQKFAESEQKLAESQQKLEDQEKDFNELKPGKLKLGKKKALKNENEQLKNTIKTKIAENQQLSRELKGAENYSWTLLNEILKLEKKAQETEFNADLEKQAQNEVKKDQEAKIDDLTTEVQRFKNADLAKQAHKKGKKDPEETIAALKIEIAGLKKKIGKSAKPLLTKQQGQQPMGGAPVAGNNAARTDDTTANGSEIKQMVVAMAQQVAPMDPEMVMMVDAINDKIATMARDIATLKATLAVSEQKLAEQNDEIKRKTGEIKALKTDKLKLNYQGQGLPKKNEGLTDDNRKLKDELDQLKKEIRTHAKQLQKVKDDMSDAKAKDNNVIKELEETIDDLQKAANNQLTGNADADTISFPNIIIDRKDIIDIESNGCNVYKGSHVIVTKNGKRVKNEFAIKEIKISEASDVELQIGHQFSQSCRLLTPLATIYKGDFIYMVYNFYKYNIQNYMECPNTKVEINLTEDMIMQQVLEAIYHLHRFLYVHRNICLRNLIFCELRKLTNGSLLVEIYSILLTDFGLCVKEGGVFINNLKSIYSAPEILMDLPHITTKADIFSAAIIFHILCYGSHPFSNMQPLANIPADMTPEKKAKIEAKNKAKIEANIMANIKNNQGAKKYPTTNLTSIYINMMLDKNPENRPTAKYLLHSPLFWDIKRKLIFLIDMYMEIRRQNRNFDILFLDIIPNGSWWAKIPRNLQVLLNGRWLRDENRHEYYYISNSKIHLLRAFRNAYCHIDKFMAKDDRVTVMFLNELLELHWPKLLPFLYDLAQNDDALKLAMSSYAFCI